MNLFNDKRRNKRVHAFGKVYKGDALSGYLIDISTGGMKVWLKENEAANHDPVSLLINPPKEISQNNISFDLYCVWKYPKITRDLDELGCQYQSLKSHQSKQIEQLINYFEQFYS